MVTILRIEGDLIVFYDDQGQVKYGMSLTAAGNVRVVGNDPCSDWVMQLIEKDWCPKEKLYEFAAMVRKLGLDEDIDWHATFQIVERNEYLDQANELKDATRLSTDPFRTSTFEELSELIRFHAEDDREISQPVIDKLVAENLTKYNLIKPG